MSLSDENRPDDTGPDVAESTTLHLVERVKHGDQQALAELLERFLTRLRRWASDRLPGAIRDMADTSDLVQDVLLRSGESRAWMSIAPGLAGLSPAGDPQSHPG